MFLNNNINNYNVDLLNCNISLHDGVPKQYYHIRKKEFDDWEIPPWELFIFKNRLLGEGSFSKVYLAKWRETFVVAKVIDETVCLEKKELVLREFENMTKLHHPNIVQFLGYINEPFIIVLEYIPRGDLKTNLSFLNKQQKITIAKDILKGLAYIHNRKPFHLIHRDIKLSNILLTSSKVAKITDFGLSKFYNYNRIASFNDLEKLNLEEDLTNNVGTERYMAPEISNNSKYNNKIDIYSCGIVLYELFENKLYLPQQGFSWYKTPKIIKEIIINKMVCTNPEERLTALEIIKQINLKMKLN